MQPSKQHKDISKLQCSAGLDLYHESWQNLQGFASASRFMFHRWGAQLARCHHAVLNFYVKDQADTCAPFFQGGQAWFRHYCQSENSWNVAAGLLCWIQHITATFVKFLCAHPTPMMQVDTLQTDSLFVGCCSWRCAKQSKTRSKATNVLGQCHYCNQWHNPWWQAFQAPPVSVVIQFVAQPSQFLTGSFNCIIACVQSFTDMAPEDCHPQVTM